jgi:hypothetical protein
MTLRIKRPKESTGIFDKNGKEIYLDCTVKKGYEYGTIVIKDGNYLIEIEPKTIRINREWEVTRKINFNK